jgi:hypothetical protein
MDSRPIFKALALTLLALAFAQPAQATTPTVSPTSHDFASQARGTVSASQAFTVKNENSGLAASNMIVAGETFSGDDFLVSSSTCGGSVLPQETCEIRVRFVPQSTTAISETMQVVTDQGTADDVTLTGTGGDLPQGPKGDKGDKGDQGIQGIQGIQGQKGDKGDQGIQGQQGDQGVKGADGVDGHIGPQGPQGDQGPMGPACPATNAACRGPRGLQGVKGAQGPPGRDAIIACKVVKTKTQGKITVVCQVNFANAR